MIRQLRLFSGLVLFAYVCTHFANHALGLVSLDAMERGRIWFLAVWRNPVGTSVLYGALTLHLSLALWKLYERRGFRMPRWEAGQIVLGLTIPPLLAEHITGTRYLSEFFGVHDTYTYVLLVLWKFAPMIGVLQVFVFLIVWLHGCIGLHYWLRIRPWYPRALPWLYAAALLLPVLALLGFVQAGREVSELANNVEWLNVALGDINFPGPDSIDAETTLLAWLRGGFAALLAAVLAARGVRAGLERRHGVFRITYPGNLRVQVTPGVSVLEASRNAGIPHASVCGGRGRCSTCRVRVGHGLAHLPPPSPGEQRVLKRVGASPNVRLACQLRPTLDLEVTPLLPPTAGPGAGRSYPGYLQGREQEIAILFADMRAFTRLAERKLPYDVVFLLNRYFRSLGEAVERAGGRVDKFIGDGVMALFGIASGPGRGCREALVAAHEMSKGLDELNDSLRNDLEEPLRIGIGIHTGDVIVGEMGYARATTVTAIGDAVNTASRLESLTKEYGCQLIVSEQVAERADVDLSAFESRQIEVRGRRDPLTVRIVPNARGLP